MRVLTLDEKISIKGVFAFHGLSLPRLTTRVEAVHFWHMVCPGSVHDWHLFRNRTRMGSGYKMRRLLKFWKKNPIKPKSVRRY